MVDEHWVGPSILAPSGDWNVASNWSGNAVPGQSDVAEFDHLAFPYTVTIHTGEQEAVSEADLNGAPGDTTIAVDGGSLEADFGQGNGGSILLSNRGTFHASSTSSLGSVSLSVQFGDGTVNTLDLATVGPVQEFGIPIFPDGFSGTISGFSGNNIITVGEALFYTDQSLVFVPNSAGGTLSITGDVFSKFGPARGLLVQLSFAGAYTAANFRTFPVNAGGQFPGYLAIGFQLNPINSTGDRRVVQGTAGADLITAAGSLDTIVGAGGNDTIVTTGSYETVFIGFLHDGVGGPPGFPNARTIHDTITLGGRGNKVSIGDESVLLTGSLGSDSITIGGGTSTLTLGPNSTLAAGRGGYTITALGGNNRLTFDDDLISRGPATVALTLGGAKNVVTLNYGLNFDAPFTLTSTGGTGSAVFNVAAGQATITTAGIYNRFDLGAFGTNSVTTGSGYATVTMETLYGLGANDIVVLDGQHNVVQGYAASLNVSGGTGSNTFNLNTGAGQAPQNISINTDGAYNSFQLSNASSNFIVAGSGFDHVVIGTPPGGVGMDDPRQLPQNPRSTVELSGTGNAVIGKDALLIVSGGTGLGTYSLTNCLGSLSEGGDNNLTTLDGSIYSIDASGSHNAFTLMGHSDAALSLDGSTGDMVFVGPGAQAGIYGATNGLRLNISAGASNIYVYDFAKDTGTFIRLLGGAGGYTTPQQAAAAIQSDGFGGSMLALGTDSIEFSAVPVGTIKASLFGIG